MKTQNKLDPSIFRTFNRDQNGFKIIPPDQFKILIENKLDDFLNKKYAKYKKISRQLYAQNALDHARKIILKGGKRTRPYLAYLAFMTYAIESGILINAPLDKLIGIEFFHSFALIHDDIIDRSLTRHGLITLHEQQKNFLSKQNKDLRPISLLDQTKYGFAQALLVGDIVFSWAFEVILSEKVSEQLKTTFHQMIGEVVIGQMIDVSIGVRKVVTNQDPEEKNTLKTARYSFVMPLLMGLILAKDTRHLSRSKNGISFSVQTQDNTYSSLARFFEKLGLVLGLAFQIQDDILDIVGDNRKIGKSTLLDVETGQHTYLSNYVFQFGNQAEKKKLSECFGKTLSSLQKSDLRTIFENCGAINHGKLMVEQYLKKAEKIIFKQKLSKQAELAWLSLIGMISQRNK